MRIPIRTDATCRGYSDGAKSENTHMEKSTRYPKKNETTTSSRMLILAVRSMLALSVRMYWRATSRRLNRMVKLPNDSWGNTSDRLYGIDVIGEVPKEAFVMKPMAMEMQNSPNAKMTYLLARFDFIDRMYNMLYFKSLNGPRSEWKNRSRPRRRMQLIDRNRDLEGRGEGAASNRPPRKMNELLSVWWKRRPTLRCVL